MRKPYPSDLTDEQCAIIDPIIPVHRVGRPRRVEMRGPQRDLLRDPLGLSVGHAATRPAAQEHRLRPLQALARDVTLQRIMGMDSPRRSGRRPARPRAAAIGCQAVKGIEVGGSRVY
ncbi:hypothetical protein EP7_001937 [Isosphaeraceae bacterium EP7]